MPIQPVCAWAGRCLAVDMEAFAEGFVKFIQSPFFTGLMITLAVLVALWILLRIYGSMRNKRLGRISYERHFSEEGVYEGDEVELIETVRNPGFFPLIGVDIESYFYNELQLEEYEPDRHSTMQYCISRFTLWPYMQIKRHHRIVAAKRGHYALHVATIYSKKNPITMEAPAELYVYPRALPLDLPAAAVGRLQGDFVSNRPLFADPFSLSGIRDYRFGDAISQINFKASARVPMTGFSPSPFKVNDRDFCASRRIMIYMNFHLPEGSMADGPEYNRRAERGLSFCAALVRDSVYAGFHVGFATNCRTMDGKLSTRFPCESSEAHMIDIMKGMACLNPTDGASFASVLDRDVQEGMRDTEIIIVVLDSGGEAPDCLSVLEQLGNSVQYIVLNDEEEEETYGTV